MGTSMKVVEKNYLSSFINVPLFKNLSADRQVCPPIHESQTSDPDRQAAYVTGSLQTLRKIDPQIPVHWTYEFLPKWHLGSSNPTG